MGHSHKDQTQSSKASHEKETFGSTPDVKNLGQGDIDGSGHGVGDDVDDGQERVILELAGDERSQTASNRNLECIDKVEREHPKQSLVLELQHTSHGGKKHRSLQGKDTDQRVSRPGHGNSLDGLDTTLSIQIRKFHVRLEIIVDRFFVVLGVGVPVGDDVGLSVGRVHGVFSDLSRQAAGRDATSEVGNLHYSLS